MSVRLPVRYVSPFERLAARKIASSPLLLHGGTSLGMLPESAEQTRQRRLAEILLRLRDSRPGDGLTSTPIPR